MKCTWNMPIFFIEASTEVIIKRFKETRRRAPARCRGRHADLGCRRARASSCSEPVRDRASAIIDTSNLSTRQAARHADRPGRGRRAVSGRCTSTVLLVRLQIRPAAGRGHGLRRAVSAEPLLHPGAQSTRTGLDEPVRNFVFQYQQTKDFVEKDRGSAGLSCCRISWTRESRSW